MAEARLVATNLVKKYGSQVAVDGVSLTVHAGEIVGLLGPNGAGKTTTIEMMEGLRRPDAGTCTICGFDSIQQNRQVRERIGITLQTMAMQPEATVLETLQLYASLYRNPMQVGDLLEQFNLLDKARTRTDKLSGGQQQRLALAVALVGRPEMLFLDEPTTGLDPQARRSLWEIILSLKAQGRSILMTTHYMDEADRLCDRVAVMDHGVILAEGSPRELTRRYGPECAIEVEFCGTPGNLAALSRLESVTGMKQEDGMVVLHTANTAATLMALAGHVQEANLPLGDLRTRTATLEDVFMALTGRRLRD